LCGAGPEREKAWRPAGRAAHQVRAGDQSRNCKKAEARDSTTVARACRRGDRMRRREFITLIGGVAATWPLYAHAQQGGRMRRIGILERGAEPDRLVQVQWRAMREGLAKLGWIEGRTVWFEPRVAAEDPDRVRAHADELVRLAPDVIAVG